MRSGASNESATPTTNHTPQKQEGGETGRTNRKNQNS